VRSVACPPPRTPAKIGVVPTEILLAYDGLSFLKALIAGELPAPPITETLGFTLTEAEPGRAVFRRQRTSGVQADFFSGFSSADIDLVKARR
jgi:hypothetical protein